MEAFRNQKDKKAKEMPNSKLYKFCDQCNNYISNESNIQISHESNCFALPKRKDFIDNNINYSLNLLKNNSIKSIFNKNDNQSYFSNSSTIKKLFPSNNSSIKFCNNIKKVSNFYCNTQNTPNIIFNSISEKLSQKIKMTNEKRIIEEETPASTSPKKEKTRHSSIPINTNLLENFNQNEIFKVKMDIIIRSYDEDKLFYLLDIERIYSILNNNRAETKLERLNYVSENNIITISYFENLEQKLSDNTKIFENEDMIDNDSLKKMLVKCKLSNDFLYLSDLAKYEPIADVEYKLLYDIQENENENDLSCIETNTLSSTYTNVNDLELFNFETEELKAERIKLCNEEINKLLYKNDLEQECLICLSQVNLNENIIILSCNHKYHLLCLSKWINHKEVCPVCFKKIINK